MKKLSTAAICTFVSIFFFAVFASASAVPTVSKRTEEAIGNAFARIFTAFFKAIFATVGTVALKLLLFAAAAVLLAAIALTVVIIIKKRK